ncbi:hypothetical protein [Agromyces sp. Leaf222]|uniref:hypothetical protein n=1 Tax=Agromyces sp. Leaf222 TaxID=1735688 RepID=UPI000700D41D|nr:hypothetical protein [Agromyces sp. Leaf222]KQM83425.1 hypothetical protein ASE68_09505 [Agromyces sp. Leaf222]
MNLEQVRAAIAEEQLVGHNLHDAHDPREDEVGVRLVPEGLVVFSNDERAVPMSERLFVDDDEAAYDEFMTRLRALNRLRRRQAERRRAARSAAEADPRRMGRPGRFVHVQGPLAAAQEVIASTFSAAGFRRVSSGTERVELVYGSGVREWAATVLPTEAFAATRRWGWAARVTIVVVQQDARRAIRVEGSAFSDARHTVGLFVETLDQAVDALANAGFDPSASVLTDGAAASR